HRQPPRATVRAVCAEGGRRAMKFALDFLAYHWLALTFLAAGLLGLLFVALFRRGLGRRFLPWALGCAARALPRVGALLPGGGGDAERVGWGVWVGGVGALALFVMAVLLLATGLWNNWASLGAAAVALVGLGAWLVNPFGAALAEQARALTETEFVHPQWLL